MTLVSRIRVARNCYQLAVGLEIAWGVFVWNEKKKGKNKRLVDCPCNCAVWGPWRFVRGVLVERGDKQTQAKSERDSSQ